MYESENRNLKDTKRDIEKEIWTVKDLKFRSKESLADIKTVSKRSQINASIEEFQPKDSELLTNDLPYWFASTWSHKADHDSEQLIC